MSVGRRTMMEEVPIIRKIIRAENSDLSWPVTNKTNLKI